VEAADRDEDWHAFGNNEVGVRDLVVLGTASANKREWCYSEIQFYNFTLKAQEKVKKETGENQDDHKWINNKNRKFKRNTWFPVRNRLFKESNI
jgi:hypothetical protein